MMNKDQMSPKLKKELTGAIIMTPETLDNTYMYHAPKPGQQEKYVSLREKGKELALLVNDLCPESREKSLAMTKIEESVMWAKAAIARNE